MILLTINLGNIVLSLLVICLFLVAVWLIIYLISKYIAPIDIVVVRSILLILFLALIIYWLAGNKVIFW